MGSMQDPRPDSMRRICFRNETLIPILGKRPSKQMQRGKGDTVFVSSPIGTAGIPPIFMRKIPSQFTSVSELRSPPPRVTYPSQSVPWTVKSY